MSETMVEKVARAIINKLHEVDGGNGHSWDEGTREMQQAMFPLAIAALEAMREPTTAMVAAANRNNHPRDADTWRTMISAALHDPEGGEGEKK